MGEPVQRLATTYWYGCVKILKCLSLFKNSFTGEVIAGWLAQSIEHAALDLGFMSFSLMSIEITLKIKNKKNFKNSFLGYNSYTINFTHNNYSIILSKFIQLGNHHNPVLEHSVLKKH